MNNNIYLENFKQRLEERKQPIDTTYLQLQSVRLFMEELGYDLAGDPNNAKNLFAKGFVRAKKEYKYDQKGEYFPRFVSFSDACRLHNGCYHWVRDDRHEFKLGKCEFIMEDITYTKALGRKLVHQVKLQQDKKKLHGFKVQNHWVSLVD